MNKYIVLVNWTDQGIRGIKDSPKRLAAVRDAGKKFGCKMTDFNLTIGAYDMVVAFEAPDDESMAKYLLTIGSQGNVRSTSLKAFSESAYKKIVGAL
ncbi:MAG: GYD domain-containing protein [Propylenella sp.]